MEAKDDIKTHFITREGCYRLQSEYPNRVGYQSNQNSPQVRVSFVSLPQNPAAQQQSSEKGKKIAYHCGISQLMSIVNCSLGSSSLNHTVNGNSVVQNGPIPTSNSLSSATTNVTSNGLQQDQNHLSQSKDLPNGSDWICFNLGKELYTYSYRGVKKVSRVPDQ